MFKILFKISNFISLCTSATTFSDSCNYSFTKHFSASYKMEFHISGNRFFFISRIIKTNFLIFLVLKDENSWESSFFAFFRCFIFHPSGVSILHFSWCYHFSLFSGVFIFHFFRVFSCCCTASVYQFCVLAKLKAAVQRSLT